MNNLSDLRISIQESPFQAARLRLSGFRYMIGPCNIRSHLDGKSMGSFHAMSRSSENQGLLAPYRAIRTTSAVSHKNATDDQERGGKAKKRRH